MINELREAQDYIQFLQSELRTIGQVVTKLRDHEERAEEEGAIGESNGTGERGGGRDGAERLVSTMKAGQGRKNEEVTRGEPLSGSSVANLLGNSNRDCFEIVKVSPPLRLPSPFRFRGSEEIGQEYAFRS